MGWRAGSESSVDEVAGFGGNSGAPAPYIPTAEELAAKERRQAEYAQREAAFMACPVLTVGPGIVVVVYDPDRDREKKVPVARFLREAAAKGQTWRMVSATEAKCSYLGGGVQVIRNG